MAKLARITPHLWLDKDASGAAAFYTSIFPESKVLSSTILQNTPSGKVEVVSFELSGHAFMAISAGPLFKFNEAVSFVIHCDTQDEIDYYWGKLSAVPEAERCGWLKDRYGLSWQVVPTAMGAMMGSGDAAKTARVTQAFLQMKKFDIAALKRAYDG
ncbi:VOC family protein [bacterium]|nr:VOC family protein [bacterium]